MPGTAMRAKRRRAVLPKRQANPEKKAKEKAKEDTNMELKE